MTLAEMNKKSAASQSENASARTRVGLRRPLRNTQTDGKPENISLLPLLDCDVIGIGGSDERNSRKAS